MCRCNAVDPKVVIGEPSEVFSLAAMGCMGVYSSPQSDCKLSA